jgi:hypothetical protein
MIEEVRMNDEAIYPTTRSVVFALVITFTVLVVYGSLRWLDIPAGNLVDWGVAIAGFWWLLGIVTIPWNLYFGARRVKQELAESARRGIEVQSSDVAYVEQTSRRALAIAVALHGISAIGFGGLALSGLTPVGWFAAAAAVGLTLFRPAARLYRHVITTLGAIHGRVRYPRDDVMTVLRRLDDLAFRTERLEADLDADEPMSWAHGVVASASQLELRIEELRAEHVAHVQTNADAHKRLSREAQRAAEQVAEDSEFLGNVREIIRFVKRA